MAKDFGRVYYLSPWESAFPTTNSLMVGRGIPGVEKIESLWPYLHEIDLFVFPDICYPDFQEYLESIGKRVWGSRHGEELEQRRDLWKKILKSVDLPVGNYTLVQGTDALREYLATHDNQWVKVNRTRGDVETFKAVNLRLVEQKLVDIEYCLGEKKRTTQFLVEDPIDDAVEIGCDTYTIDGEFPATALSGIEIKDAGYVGHVRPYGEALPQLREANAKLAPLFEDYGYRNLWCAETRITRDGTGYLLDPCCRFGSPPSELWLYLASNIADILWHGSEGDVVDLVPAYEWGASLCLRMEDAPVDIWQPVDFPAELRDQVKLKFPTVIDDRYYIVPTGHSIGSIGAVVAGGATMSEAIENVKRAAEQVEAFYVTAPVKAMDDAQAEVAKLQSFGYDL